jgi:hypothetical protein
MSLRSSGLRRNHLLHGLAASSTGLAALAALTAAALVIIIMVAVATTQCAKLAEWQPW